MSTLIIGQSDDAHIPFVVKHLREEPLIIDTRDLVEGADLTYEYGHQGLSLWYRGKDITDIQSVWLRRPAALDKHFALPIPDIYKEYSLSALGRFMHTLYCCLPNALWISDHFAIQRAENKPYQQLVAHGIGFKIPKTIYTTDSKQAKVFVQSCRDPVVKPLAIRFPPLEEKVGTKAKGQFFFTRRVSSTLNYEGLHLAPAIFQEGIEPKNEFRVTVVKDKVFSALIRLNSKEQDPSERDWRLLHDPDRGSLSFHAHTLPTQITDKCIKLVDKLGLKYGAIDLIEDEAGIFWFLEINSNGQWAFIEEATGQPIGKAIANLLES